MRKCCIRGCQSNYCPPYVPTFLFPKDPIRRKAWEESVSGRTAIKISSCIGVCIKHFEKDCVIHYNKFETVNGVINTERKKIKLKPDALPTIFPVVPSINKNESFSTEWEQGTEEKDQMFDSGSDVEIIDVCDAKPNDSINSSHESPMISPGPVRVKDDERKPTFESPIARENSYQSRRSSVGSNSSNGSSDVIKSPVLASKRRKIEKAPPTVTGRQNDCYCWICHKENITLTCFACPRAYHQRCSGENDCSEDWVCTECSKITAAENVDTQSKTLSDISLDKFCMLLKCCISKLKLRAPAAFHQPVPVSYYSSYLDYVIHPMDLSLIEKNVKQKLYGCTESFLADVKWLHHNSFVFNGAQHPLTLNARALVKTCDNDLSEIEVCPDCFLHAFNRSKNWFSEICRKPHALVWAKLKGFPYWPAKVARIVNGDIDARFFGAHDRAWVPVSQCYHLSKEMPTSSKPKKKGNYETALEELEIHVQLLQQKYGTFHYAPYRTPFDPNNEIYIYKKLDAAKVVSKNDGDELDESEAMDDSEMFRPSSNAFSSGSSTPYKMPEHILNIDFEEKFKQENFEPSSSPDKSDISDATMSTSQNASCTEDLKFKEEKKESSFSGIFEVTRFLTFDDCPPQNNPTLKTGSSPKSTPASSDLDLESFKKLEDSVLKITEVFSNYSESEKGNVSSKKMESPKSKVTKSLEWTKAAVSERTVENTEGVDKLGSSAGDAAAVVDEIQKVQKSLPEAEVLKNDQSSTAKSLLEEQIAAVKKNDFFSQKLDETIKSCKAKLGLVNFEAEESSSESEEEEDSSSDNDNASTDNEESDSAESSSESSSSEESDNQTASEEIENVSKTGVMSEEVKKLTDSVASINDEVESLGNGNHTSPKNVLITDGTENIPVIHALSGEETSDYNGNSTDTSSSKTVDALILNVDNDKDKKYDVESSVSAIQNEVTDADSSVSTIQNEGMEVDSSISTIHNEVTNVDSSVSIIQDEVTDVDLSDLTIQNEVMDVDSSVSTIQNGETNVASSISTVQNKLMDVDSSVSMTQNKVIGVAPPITTVQNEATKVDSSDSSIENKIHELAFKNSKITSLSVEKEVHDVQHNDSTIPNIEKEIIPMECIDSAAKQVETSHPDTKDEIQDCESNTSDLCIDEDSSDSMRIDSPVSIFKKETCNNEKTSSSPLSSSMNIDNVEEGASPCPSAAKKVSNVENVASSDPNSKVHTIDLEYLYDEDESLNISPLKIRHTHHNDSSENSDDIDIYENMPDMPALKEGTSETSPPDSASSSDMFSINHESQGQKVTLDEVLQLRHSASIHKNVISSSPNIIDTVTEPAKIITSAEKELDKNLAPETTDTKKESKKQTSECIPKKILTQQDTAKPKKQFHNILILTREKNNVTETTFKEYRKSASPSSISSPELSEDVSSYYEDNITEPILKEHRESVGPNSVSSPKLSEDAVVKNKDVTDLTFIDGRKSISPHNISSPKLNEDVSVNNKDDVTDLTLIDCHESISPHNISSLKSNEDVSAKNKDDVADLTFINCRKSVSSHNISSPKSNEVSVENKDDSTELTLIECRKSISLSNTASTKSNGNVSVKNKYDVTELTFIECPRSVSPNNTSPLKSNEDASVCSKDTSNVDQNSNSSINIVQPQSTSSKDIHVINLESSDDDDYDEEIQKLLNLGKEKKNKINLKDSPNDTLIDLCSGSDSSNDSHPPENQNKSEDKMFSFSNCLSKDQTAKENIHIEKKQDISTLNTVCDKLKETTGSSDDVVSLEDSCSMEVGADQVNDDSSSLLLSQRKRALCGSEDISAKKQRLDESISDRLVFDETVSEMPGAEKSTVVCDSKSSGCSDNAVSESVGDNNGQSCDLSHISTPCEQECVPDVFVPETNNEKSLSINPQEGDKSNSIKQEMGYVSEKSRSPENYSSKNQNVDSLPRIAKLENEVKELKDLLRILHSKYQKQQWYHSRELQEMQHNMSLVVMEMRSSMESDKKESMDNLQKDSEADKLKAYENIKMRQWCKSCKLPSIFFCCWNTSYCSYTCQKHHWPQHRFACTQDKATQPQKPAPALTEYVKIAKKPAPADNNATRIAEHLVKVGESTSQNQSNQVQFVTSNSQLQMIPGVAQLSTSVSNTSNQPVQILLAPAVPSEIKSVPSKSYPDSSDIITKVRSRQTDLTTAIQIINRLNKETEETLKKKPEDGAIPAPSGIVFALPPSEMDVTTSKPAARDSVNDPTSFGDGGEEEKEHANLLSDCDDGEKKDDESSPSMISVGFGLELPSKQLNECLKSATSANQLAGYMLAIVFAMQKSSKGGALCRKSNIIKSGLTGEIVNAILGFVMKKYPHAQRAEIVLAMSQKYKEVREKGLTNAPDVQLVVPSRKNREDNSQTTGSTGGAKTSASIVTTKKDESSSDNMSPPQTVPTHLSNSSVVSTNAIGIVPATKPNIALAGEIAAAKPNVANPNIATMKKPVTDVPTSAFVAKPTAAAANSNILTKVANSDRVASLQTIVPPFVRAGTTIRTVIPIAVQRFPANMASAIAAKTVSYRQRFVSNSQLRPPIRPTIITAERCSNNLQLPSMLTPIETLCAPKTSRDTANVSAYLVPNVNKENSFIDAITAVDQQPMPIEPTKQSSTFQSSEETVNTVDKKDSETDASL